MVNVKLKLGYKVLIKGWNKLFIYTKTNNMV